MELLHQPLIPFDPHARQKLVDGLPQNYRDWFARWERTLAG